MPVRKLLPLGERKLIPMGMGGLVLTIPKAYIRFFQLKVGDKLELEMDTDGELHIRPKQLPILYQGTSNEN